MVDSACRDSACGALCRTGSIEICVAEFRDKPKGGNYSSVGCAIVGLWIRVVRRPGPTGASTTSSVVRTSFYTSKPPHPCNHQHHHLVPVIFNIITSSLNSLTLIFDLYHLLWPFAYTFLLHQCVFYRQIRRGTYASPNSKPLHHHMLSFHTLGRMTRFYLQI